MQLDFSVRHIPFRLIIHSTSLTHPKIYNTLLVDKNHRMPAAAQASSNIIRCGLAAIAVAFLQDMIDAVGIGWTFTFMGSLCGIACGLFCVDYHWGTRWRRAHYLRAAARKQQG